MAARHLRSNLSSNLGKVRSMTGLDPWIVGKEQLCSALDKAVKREVPEQDSWRPVCLQKLLAATTWQTRRRWQG